MKKKLFFVLPFFMAFLALVSCGSNNTAKDVINNEENAIDDSKNNEVIGNGLNHNTHNEIHGQYNEGVLLLKSSNTINNIDIDGIEYESINQLYKGSKWYEVKLKDSIDTLDAYNLAKESNLFDGVDLDYIMKGDGEIESVDISGNPESGNQIEYLESHGIFDGWGYAKNENKSIGGSPDVIVAVIDTGVDYNHIDLRNNIWKNTAEIPNNGIDDDNNGYIDDYYGWDCVNHDNDPMDDNGHGTHVAGIIAAENNLIGTVGVAFNCKIMCLKAGNSSGNFANSNIAEAIQYAYMNGASVINMSFGGPSISLAVEDALADAYYQCVLVAAAGNDGVCNNLEHVTKHEVGLNYPAALPYVIGVMSTNATGTTVSKFSNYDDTPHDSIEYEVYACGENIPSTFPNNKYACLSGTSMASPMVAGIAALLRSYYTDRDIYSNKYIQSQIVNTSSINPFNGILEKIDEYHSFANVYDALTKNPTPKIERLSNYYCFDNAEYSENNNGDGFINPNETIRLGIELFNYGGFAKNVTARIETSGLSDPVFTIVKDEMYFMNIGTYSNADSGKIYEDKKVIDINNYFELKVANECSNGYSCKFNVIVSYENGLNENDHTIYTSEFNLSLGVNRGKMIYGIINEDMTFTSDYEYIIPAPLTITANATVTFEEGCKVRFYAYDTTNMGLFNDVPNVSVYGKLYFNGSSENMITIQPSLGFERYRAHIEVFNGGEVHINYSDVYNITCHVGFYDNDSIFEFSNSRFQTDYVGTFHNNAPDNYGAWYGLEVTHIYNSYIDNRKNNESLSYDVAENNVFLGINHFGVGSYRKQGRFINNLVILYYEFDSYDHYYKFRIYGNEFENLIKNNVFVIAYSIDKINEYPKLVFEGTNSDPTRVSNIILNGNVFDELYDLYPENLITGNINTENGSKYFDIITDLDNHNDSLIYPYIKSIELFDDNDTLVNIVNNGAYNIKVTFSKTMDITQKFNLYYGTKYPYADYKITGEFVNDTEWIGSLVVKSTIESGDNYFSCSGGYSIDDKKIIDTCSKYKFVIDNISSLSMNLQANATNDGVNLTWIQDDYDTLMGYNIYRSETKDGNYIKLNNVIIPENENAFLDENGEPGKTYWYTFTVVLSDMSESNPAGKVVATMLDTEKPNLYHTPVNQGYLNNNLVIYCTASDNVGITSVILYYKTKGETTWKQLTMLKQNDKYFATIFGSELSLDGLEYYIVASDGVNTINKGNEDSSYNVLIKDSSALAMYGDVDGDGIITTKDALMIIKAINGDLILTDDQFKRADLNKDNTLSSVEALRILQYINGNVITLEM